jgi:predicted acylesterase/phospholipase RssA
MPEGDRGKPTNIFQVVSRAVCAAQKHQLEMWERHADLIIRPDVHSLAWDDFDRADEAIEAGKTAAKIALPRILKLLAENDALQPRIANPAELNENNFSDEKFSDKHFSDKEFSNNRSHFITEAINS